MSGVRIAVVDAGPLYAVADSGDADHRPCRDVLERGDLALVIPALAVCEATWLVGRRLGPKAEAAFLRGLSSFDVVAPDEADLKRMAELVVRYRDFPLGGTDASVIVLAERMATDLVVTLDRRHFGAVKPRHCPRFEILPSEG